MDELKGFLASDVCDSMLENHTVWCKEENMEFEKAIAELDPSSPSFFEDIASRLPSKSIEDIKIHYQALVEDVDMIEDGLIKPPQYKDDQGTSGKGQASSLKRKTRTVSKDTTGKGPWTEEEQRSFLKGLEKCVKGDWRSISRHYVPTRTPTQVASHAQKYFRRLQTSTPPERRRPSINDIQIVSTTTDNAITTTTDPNPTITPTATTTATISTTTITASVPPAPTVTPAHENPLQVENPPPSFPYYIMSNANNSQQETDNPYLHYHSLTFPSPITTTDTTTISVPPFNQMNLQRTELPPPLHNNLMVNANGNWEQGDGFINNLPPAMAPSSAFPMGETTTMLQFSTASSSYSSSASPTWFRET